MHDETGAILHDQHPVAELDGLRGFAAVDHLGVRLKEAEDLLGVGDRLTVDHPAGGQISHVFGCAQKVLKLGGEFLIEPANPRRRQGIEGLDLLVAVQGAFHDHVAMIEQRAVAVLKRLFFVFGLAAGDFIDPAFHAPSLGELMGMLAPAR